MGSAGIPGPLMSIATERIPRVLVIVRIDPAWIYSGVAIATPLRMN